MTMPILLPDRVPWFVAGPLMGLVVVALYALANQKLGITASYNEVVDMVRGRATESRWRFWFLIGLIGGGVLAAALRGGPALDLGYGALGLLLPIGILVPVLFVGGALMGYGARWSGGCTAGHGLGGSSSLSKASFVATATFMATAIAVTYALHFLTGGAL